MYTNRYFIHFILQSEVVKSFKWINEFQNYFFFLLFRGSIGAFIRRCIYFFNSCVWIWSSFINDDAAVRTAFSTLHVSSYFSLHSILIAKCIQVRTVDHNETNQFLIFIRFINCTFEIEKWFNLKKIIGWVSSRIILKS